MKNSLENTTETRQPILGAESARRFAKEEMGRQWHLLTETIRQEILTEPTVRTTVREFMTQPVDESLPRLFLEALGTNERLAKLAQRYQQGIVSYLQLPAVPDKHLTPDIRHASGITNQEKIMTIRRYRFARDIKLLALQAEVAEMEEGIEMDDQQVAKLADGTIIATHVDDKEKRAALLSPQNWEKRRQIKDRVYEVQIGGSAYILKEQKTNRHTDTMKSGHKPGATSQEEFETAQYFQEHGTVDQGDIKVSWEKPVAAVTFSDGFQFALFEKEEDAFSDKDSRNLLQQEIMAHHEQFEMEYEEIKRSARNFYHDPVVLACERKDSRFGLREALKKFGLLKEKDPELTFEEFSRIKSIHTHQRANSLMRSIYRSSDYSDSDSTDSSLRVNTRNGNVQLEIFCFDFEYFHKLSIEEKKHRDEMYQKSLVRREKENPFGALNLWIGGKNTRTQRAGYLALLEADKDSRS